jgi:survival-of-motor-neuron-related-splicing factor 30
MESREELDAKIIEYTDQLKQVDGFLSSDPDNAQFLKLKEDLQKVIDLTKLINSQHEDHNSSSSYAQNNEEEDDDNDLDNEDYDNEHSSGTTGITGTIQVGECVEVLGGDRPYPGTVTGIIDESTFKVKYFEFETEVSLPSSSLFRIPATSDFKIEAQEIKIGQKGIYQCRYATDQVFYDCIVQSLTEHGCVVKYTLYGNVEEAPVAYLKTVIAAVKKGSTDAPQQGLIALPENLRFLPTDTDEDKARKRKKIKAIKSKNRLFTKDAEITAVQNTWQKFVSKGTKKSGPAVAKKSMFASSDAVDGKIGNYSYVYLLSALKLKSLSYS